MFFCNANASFKNRIKCFQTYMKVVIKRCISFCNSNFLVKFISMFYRVLSDAECYPVISFMLVLLEIYLFCWHVFVIRFHNCRFEYTVVYVWICKYICIHFFLHV